MDILSNFYFFHTFGKLLSHFENGRYATAYFMLDRTNVGFRLACRLPLTALPLRCMITACRFMVYKSQRPCHFGLSLSGIAPELNRSLYVICCGGQSGKVIDLLARRCLPLGHPSAASGACAVVQISSSKQQCGKWQASLKVA